MIPTALKLHPRVVNKLQHDEAGATAIEYGLLLGLVAIAIIATLGIFGTEMVEMFAAWNTAVSEAADKATDSSTG